MSKVLSSNSRKKIALLKDTLDTVARNKPAMKESIDEMYSAVEGIKAPAYDKLYNGVVSAYTGLEEMFEGIQNVLAETVKTQSEGMRVFSPGISRQFKEVEKDLPILTSNKSDKAVKEVVEDGDENFTEELLNRFNESVAKLLKHRYQMLVDLQKSWKDNRIQDEQEPVYKQMLVAVQDNTNMLGNFLKEGTYDESGELKRQMMAMIRQMEEQSGAMASQGDKVVIPTNKYGEE